ncbi:MAG TPA: ribosome silencing factor [Thermopetrobacter sp.]|nr:ribosome silencing factor [Thermopetrobacter sp.]
MNTHTLAAASATDAADPAAPADDAAAGDSRALVRTILSSLADSKAEEIVTIPLEPGAALADSMVIASGRSARHVAAVADRLLDDMKKAGFRRFSVEGLDNADWVLVDAGDVIVHIFRPEVRDFYNLEKLWSPQAPRRNA